MAKEIKITGASEHNLKNIDVSIPRDKLVVITGISGSGKSSLAFDTIYAEGQRKYIESLSAYARQFLNQMQKPHIEHIEGLPPTIAIEQRSGSSNPRSTVATTTEIYDYCRLLFARVGQPHCWICGEPITSQHSSQIVDSILERPVGTKLQICAPLIRGQKGEHREIFARVQREGFVRVRVDGVIYDVKNVPALDKNKKHDIAAVVDRLIIKDSIRIRLADSIETALKIGDSSLVAMMQVPKEDKTNGGNGDWEDVLYSEKFACTAHPEVALEELSPRLFSFNSPYGACRSCDGLGTILEFEQFEQVDGPMMIAIDMTKHDRRGGGQAQNMGRLNNIQPLLGRNLVGTDHRPHVIGKDFRGGARQGIETSLLEFGQKFRHRNSGCFGPVGHLQR